MDPQQQYTQQRSPLMYFGGKFDGVPEIRALIPPGIQRLVSPFFGGGAIEMSAALDGIEVRGADAVEPLVDFWTHTIQDASKVADLADTYRPMSPSMFNALQRDIYDMVGIERAAAYYALNRSTYRGGTLVEGMRPGSPRFNEPAIQRLRALQLPSDRLSVVHSDFVNTLEDNPTDFLYLDPPYPTGRDNLYGSADRPRLHSDFNHILLRDMLAERDGWILSYNNRPGIRELYKDFPMHVPNFTHNKRGEELLIYNID